MLFRDHSHSCPRAFALEAFSAWFSSLDICMALSHLQVSAQMLPSENPHLYIAPPWGSIHSPCLTHTPSPSVILCFIFIYLVTIKYRVVSAQIREPHDLHHRCRDWGTVTGSRWLTCMQYCANLCQNSGTVLLWSLPHLFHFSFLLLFYVNFQLFILNISNLQVTGIIKWPPAYPSPKFNDLTTFVPDDKRFFKVLVESSESKWRQDAYP